MKKNILMAALVLLFVGCGGNIKTEPINYDWSNTTIRTTGQMLHNDSVLIGKMICDIYKDHLFFYNDKRAAGKHLSCFRLSGDSLVYKGQLLGIGKGPHEALMTQVGLLGSEDKLIFANSVGTATVTDYYELPLQPLDSIFNPNSLVIKKAPKVNSIIKAVPISADSFLVMELKTESTEGNSMFGYYETGDETVTDLNILYPDNGKNYSNIVKSTAYLGFLVKHPQKSQFIYSSQYGNYVVLFELRDKKIVNVKELYNAHPDYTSPDGYNFKMEKFVYGMLPFATEQYIYLKPMHDGQGSWYTDEIFVFDWAGSPVKKIVTDRPTATFVVNSDDTYLYATSVDTETEQDCILKIEL